MKKLIYEVDNNSFLFNINILKYKLQYNINCLISTILSMLKKFKYVS